MVLFNALFNTSFKAPSPLLSYRGKLSIDN